MFIVIRFHICRLFPFPSHYFNPIGTLSLENCCGRELREGFKPLKTCRWSLEPLTEVDQAHFSLIIMLPIEVSESVESLVLTDWYGI